MAVVVMAVGAAPELGSAVASLLAQDVAAEIVVVNSGGGDVAARLPSGADGVRIVTCEETVWPGAARNRGLAATNARYVAFLAADCVAAPGWVAGRLERHRAGARAVASSVTCSAPRNPVAWASHLSLYGRRRPTFPADKAPRYGASYERGLFHEFGPFHEALRIGEDSEFHLRMGKTHAPVWGPEILTTHRDTTTPLAAIRDHYRRGVRSGRYWPQKQNFPIATRIYRRVTRLWSALMPTLTPRERLAACVAAPMLAALAAAVEIGADVGRRRPDKIVLLEERARRAEKKRNWREALSCWSASSKARPGSFRALLGRAEALTRLGRFDEALAAYDAISAGWPDLAIGHCGVGRTAARLSRWERSLDAWTRADSLWPDRSEPVAGRGAALLGLGRIEEAHAAYACVAGAWPDAGAGLQGLADVAMERRDWPVALATFETLWTRFGEPTAVERRVRLLIGLDRLDEAADVVSAFEASGPELPARVGVALPLLTARQDFAAIAALLGKNERLLHERTDLLRTYVDALANLGRTTEALSLIEKSPSKKRGMQFLEVYACLRAGWREQAQSALERIFAAGPARVPLPLIAGVLACAVETGGVEGARALAARIEAGDGKGQVDTLTRLTILFHGARLDSLEDLLGSPARARARPMEGACLQRLQEAGNERLKLANLSTLLETCERFARLRESRGRLFLDPSNSLEEALGVVSAIVEAVDAGAPFSLIRLGDGEGNVLPYRADLAAYQASDRIATQRTWWGEDRLAGEGESRIVAMLGDAIDSADMIGVPDIHRVCRAFSAARFSDFSGPAKHARGVLAVCDLLLAPGGPADAADVAITSSNVHQALAQWGLWDILLPRLGPLDLVTCHPALDRTLSERYGAQRRRVFLIPPEHKFAAAFDGTRAGRHYPDVFEELRETFSQPMAGRVVLVAAGVLGKIYCHWIKSSGGVAIDAGSAADWWAGYDTRSLDVGALFHTPPGVGEALLRLASEDRRMATLLKTQDA